MINLFWKLLAKLVSIPSVANYLIERSKRTPYFDLEGYMERWWLFNPYQADPVTGSRGNRKIRWLPAVRVHHILRADDARDLHDHPWNARTIILKGWYAERRITALVHDSVVVQQYLRETGDTQSINFGEYHSIDGVSQGGVYTLFFTWDYVGMWGFLVDGVKVPWQQYVNGGKA